MAAPALGITVGVVRRPEEPATLLEVIGDLARDVTRFLALKPAVPLDEARHLVDRDEDRELLRFRQREVLGAATRRDVDETGPFRGGDILPLDHAVADNALARRR